ncbi:MAG: DoxX family membrane protein [candidate division Zixibacteria bacterium]|nr:DoxX family membrane protein [candidate division Zixibacteria bacterium]
MRLNKWVVLAIRVIIGGIFIYDSIDKIIHPEAFARIVHNYRLFPPSLINIIAIVVPWIELISGALLIVGWRYKAANLIIGGMLTAFIIALSISYIRGININCGCFSTSASSKSDLLMRIFEDIMMVTGCIIIGIASKNPNEKKEKAP